MEFAPRYWLADALAVELSASDRPTLIVPRHRCRVHVDGTLLLLLSRIADRNAEGRAATFEDIGCNSALDDVMRELLRLGVIVDESSSTSGGQRPSSAIRLSPIEWATLKMSQIGGAIPPESEAHGAQGDEGAALLQPLPEPEAPPAADLWNTLSVRRSTRTGLARRLTLDMLSSLLTYSCRAQQRGRDAYGDISLRPVASGGARHPIETFLVPLRVSALEPDIYRYCPATHALGGARRHPGEVEALVRTATLALGDAAQSPLPGATLFFAAVPDRTAAKYKDNALKLIFADFGCLVQQLYLVVTGLGLRGCALGGGDPDTIEDGLGLRAGAEVFIGGFAIW